MKRPSIFLLLATIALAAGCASPPREGEQGTVEQPANDPSAAWPYWPVRMRVHPLSRLVVEPDGRIVVEARLEFFDRDDQTTRACGRVRMELRDGGASVPSGGEIAWNADLTNAAENRQRFDDVLRTYLLRLETDWDQWPAEPVLHAWFLSSDGARLQATRQLATE